MALLATIFGSPRNSIENPSTPLSDFDATGWGVLGGNSMSASGVKVTRQTAITLPAFWRAVDLMSDFPGKLPFEVFETTERGEFVDKRHFAYRLVRYAPNPQTTAYTFFKTVEAHACTSGNGYAYILRSGDAVPVSLHHLDPDQTWPIRVNGAVSYVTLIDGKFIPMPFSDVYHVAGLGFDGMVGYSIVAVASGCIGLGIATLEYAGRYFRNNSEPRVVIEVPGAMPPDAQTSFLKQWDRIHQGPENSHKTAIVTNGGKVSSLSINARDSQLIEQRNMTLIDLSNVTGLPPHLLGNGQRAAYNSLSEENRSLLTNKVEGRLQCHEQQAWSKLLTEKQKRSMSHFFRFDRTTLTVSGDQERASYYRAATAGAPWMTIDEVRSAEGLNPIEGDFGDELILPANLRDTPEPAPSDSETVPPESGPEPEPPPQRPRPTNTAHVNLLAHCCKRMAERIAKGAERASKKPAEFTAMLEGLSNTHFGPMVSEFAPLLAACQAAVGVEETAEALAGKVLAQARAELVELAQTTQGGGRYGAVAEWSKRFTGAAMDKLVAEVFEDTRRDAA